MAERLNLFATPVLKSRPPDADRLCRDLRARILKRRAASPTLNRSNVGGWHSDTDMSAWGGEGAVALANFAVAEVSTHMIDVARQGKRQFNWSIEMWANVNGPGDSNNLHCHPAAYWSGVFYPDPGGAEAEDGGGELLLEDPRYPLAYMTVPDLLLRQDDGSPMQSQIALRPEAGLLVLFPAWLRHSVRPHRGTGERVSVALNLMPVGARAKAGAGGR